MRDAGELLANATAESIESEVTDASEWLIKTHDRMWRNPKSGQVLEVYAEAMRPGTPEWTGGTMDIYEITCEFTHPSRGQTRLKRDEEATEAAHEVAGAIRTWALSHHEGLHPVDEDGTPLGDWKLDYGGHFYTPRVRPEIFVRYIRCSLLFTVNVSFA